MKNNYTNLVLTNIPIKIKTNIKKVYLHIRFLLSTNSYKANYSLIFHDNCHINLKIYRYRFDKH